MRIDQAEAAYQYALACRDDFTDAMIGMGLCRDILADNQGACSWFERALIVDPDNLEARVRHTDQLAKLGRREEAERALARLHAGFPDRIEVMSLEASLLYENNCFLDAREALHKVQQLLPGRPDISSKLAGTYIALGQITQAEKIICDAMKQSPYRALFYSSWASLALASPDYDEKRLYEIHTYCGTNLARGLRPISRPVPDRDPDRPLRVGYLSYDLRHHSVSSFLLPVIQAHDPSRIQAFGYHLNTQADRMTEQLQAACYGWADVAHLNCNAIARHIADNHIDILVDLAVHTRGARPRVFPLRPAPVQLAWLGYAGTSGMPGIDYRLTDAIADPGNESDRYHSETLIRLEKGFLCFHPRENAPAVVPIAGSRKGRDHIWQFLEDQ